MKRKIDNITGANYNVPSYIGEFNMMQTVIHGVQVLNY